MKAWKILVALEATADVKIMTKRCYTYYVTKWRNGKNRVQRRYLNFRLVNRSLTKLKVFLTKMKNHCFIVSFDCATQIGRCPFGKWLARPAKWFAISARYPKSVRWKNKTETTSTSKFILNFYTKNIVWNIIRTKRKVSKIEKKLST